MSHWLLLLEFASLALVIGIAGYFLALYGDVIAEKTGLGGSWVGFSMLATVTSLPELVTGISSVTYVGVPDIALGDALGSCVFNLLLIVMLDFMHRGSSVYTRASQGHILSAGFGVVLLGFVAFNILLYRNGFRLSLWHIGLYAPIIVLFYIVSMRTVFRFEKAQHLEAVEEIAERHPKMSLAKAIAFYCVAAAVVIAAGIRLPLTADHVAQAMDWQRSFVGTVFVALATSMPEVAVTFSAFRIGALDMAISDLFGSNLFNLVIIALDDVAYVKGPLLADVSSAHLISAQSAIMMTGVAIVGLLYRPNTRLFKTVGWVSLFIFSIFILNISVLYLQH
ncbi:sodium:calcium antiporter [Methylomicrobium lacus]|uniref:sodium:calcium antiporter n=1 Tax=Methylomicrobium lacus TaxID=136992 RepID=UPI0035A955F6